MPDSVRSHYQYFTEADISRLRNAGYAGTFTPFEEAVEDYVRNYLVPGKYLPQ
jgi:ADP-L-glycero-D-manno-heptose 6-epimerase